MAHRHTTQQFVTLREAARCLGIGVRAVYRARDRGELATYQFGTPWCWVRLSDARAWLECHRRPRTHRPERRAPLKVRGLPDRRAGPAADD